MPDLNDLLDSHEEAALTTGGNGAVCVVCGEDASGKPALIGAHGLVHANGACEHASLPVRLTEEGAHSPV